MPNDEQRAEDLSPPAGEVDSTCLHIPAVDSGQLFAGRYKLREKLGEGGMGVVFAADQIEPVKRRVAIKIIRAALDGPTLLARFDQERQALALMDHPNIAKVLDAGVDEHGRPYFAMELVKGLPLTKYCDEAKLSPRQRLELFAPVCQAVQHAHQKGIIHRDLKPSNILVALLDGRPTPKVIDFGVAKVTGARLTEQSIYTEIGSIVGTLEYMSPEQAELNNLDVDTRSDVYALGVVLYELLTGQVPFSRRDLEKAGLAGMLQLIREAEPARPSTKLSGSGSLPSIAAQRDTEPKKLTALIRGELDWIVMKALEKDRSRRYETANDLAADVERHLAGEPVQAAPASQWYRTRKFLRRNRGPVAAAALVLLVLVGGILGTGYGLVQATAARRDAEAAALREGDERRRAEAMAAEANAVVKFFDDKVFVAGRPKGEVGGLGHDVSLRDAVMASLSSLRTSFADQPLLEARMRFSLGTTLGLLGEPEHGAEQERLAHALYARHLGPDHSEALKTLNNLAISYASLNRHAEAFDLFTEVLAAQKRVLPAEDPLTLTCMNNLANCLHALNRNSEALNLREEVLAIRRRVLPPDDPDLLVSINSLANSCQTANRHADALRLREEALAASRRILPPDHRETLMTMLNLANSFDAMNRRVEALGLREEVLAIRKRVLPRDHPDTLMSMSNLAFSYQGLNRPGEAVALREEVLAIRKRLLPPDHRDVLTSMYNLAFSYHAAHRDADALKLREEVLAKRRRLLPPDHPELLACTVATIESLVRLGRTAEAIPLIDECTARPARPPIQPGDIATLLSFRLDHFRKLGDAAACRTTAEKWEKSAPTDPDGLYNAACFRAVAAAVQAKAKDADAVRLAQTEAEKAMAWLTKAVAAGWKDAEHMKKDPDLDSLRMREDFRKLVKRLEAR